MKLFFEKKDNEIIVKMQVGTIVEDFSYTKMVKQLLKNNQFDDTQFKGLSQEEKERVEEMLERITEALEEEDDDEDT